jgi:hypothetical protein
MSDEPVCHPDGQDTHPTQTVGPVAQRHHDTANDRTRETTQGSELVVGFITSEM